MTPWGTEYESEQLEFEIPALKDEASEVVGLTNPAMSFISWEDLRRDYGVEPVDIESVPVEHGIV